MRTKYQFFLIPFFLLVVATTMAPSAYAGNKGEKNVGLRAGFTTRNTTATTGLYFSYRFSNHFRLAPKIDYAFLHHSVDAFSFDVDAEIPIALSTSKEINFYPIGGLNYSTFTHHVKARDETSDDTSQRTNEFGLSLGAGVEYFATPSLRLALESKGILVKKYSGGWFSISIGYRF